MDYNYKYECCLTDFEETFKENQEKSITIMFRHKYSHLFFSNVRALRRAINSHFYSHEVLFLNVFSFESAFARMIHIHPYGCNISWGWKPEQSIKERLIYQDFFFEDNSNIKRAFFRAKNTGLHSSYAINGKFVF